MRSASPLPRRWLCCWRLQALLSTPPQRRPPPTSTAAASAQSRLLRRHRCRCHRRPTPQHNAYQLYSDQDYARGQEQCPKSFSHLYACATSRRRSSQLAALDRSFSDGKMYLSIDDAVALALENNLDIGIQRYNLSTADTDILRTSSGAAALGVNAGLVQGTPGGTTGTTSAGGTGTSTTGIDRRRGGRHQHRRGRAAQAQPASSPRPRAKARRSTISIRSSPAPVLERPAISPTTNISPGPTS